MIFRLAEFIRALIYQIIQIGKNLSMILQAIFKKINHESP